MIEIIDSCTSMVGFNKRVYPKGDLNTNSTTVNLHHVVETMFFGFLNDFYVLYQQIDSF